MRSCPQEQEAVRESIGYPAGFLETAKHRESVRSRRTLSPPLPNVTRIGIARITK